MVMASAGSVSRMIDNACGAHLWIEEAVAESGNKGVSVRVKATVKAATDSAQVGKSITEFFQIEGNAVDKLYNLAEAVGLITAQQRAAAAKAGVGMEIREDLMRGRQFCAQIKMEPNMRKNPTTGQNEVDPEKPGPYPRLGFNTFGVFDDKAKAIPKDPALLAMLGPRPVQTQAAPSPAPTSSAPLSAANVF